MAMCLLAGDLDICCAFCATSLVSVKFSRLEAELIRSSAESRRAGSEEFLTSSSKAESF